MIRTELLKEVNFFKGFKPEDLELLKGICEKKKVGASHTVFREGEKAGSMFLVELGSVRIIKNIEDVVIFARGDIFGEVPFFDNGLRQGTAVALEDSHLVEIPYRDLTRLLEHHPSMAVGFYSAAARFTSKKLRFYIDRLSHVQEIAHSQRHHQGSLLGNGQESSQAHPLPGSLK